MSIAMHGVDTHQMKFVTLHGVKLNAQWYTWSDALYSCLYME